MSYLIISPKNEIEEDIREISDFASLKVSALGKASRISGEIDRITIGPNSIAENECDKSENIENEQNSCNIKSPTKLMDKQNKISTQNGITFSVRKILLESELQRKEEVRKEVERHWQHMKENGKAIQEHMARSQASMAQERERKSAEKFATILAEEEKIAEQEELKRKHEQQLQAQRSQEQKLKLEREMEEYRRRMKEKEELYRKVTSLRNEFGTKYYEIVTLSKGCKNKNSVAFLLSSYASRLKEVCQQTEQLDKRIKMGELVPGDINIGEMIARNITEILASIKAAIEKIDAHVEANIPNNAEPLRNANTVLRIPKRQETVTVRQPQEAQVPVETQVHSPHVAQLVDTPGVAQSNSERVGPPKEPVAQPAKPEGNLYQYVDRESLQMYINSQQFLENHLKSHNEFLQSPSTKKLRFECQKAINIPVNAISAANPEHLRDKYERLQNLLIGRASPNVLKHPQGAAFCKNILAKKIVSQGETLVSSKPETAFPIAAIAVALWNDHPDFGDLLLAHFHSTCPFTVPVFMPKTEGQSNESYYRLMGYQYTEDGIVEKHDKYLKRMSGVMRLYASITITVQRKGINKSRPHGVQHAWRWLAAVLNTEPRPMTTDLCATLILDMLQVTGHVLWTAYPRQFPKMLLLLSEEYYPRMQKVGSIGGGPIVRLEEFLKNTLSKRSIPPSEGQLPINFW